MEKFVLDVEVRHSTFLKTQHTCKSQIPVSISLSRVGVSNTVEPLNNGHVGDECFVHYSEVVPSSEVVTCIQLLAGGTQFVNCREVVRSSECPLSEVPL